MTLVLSMNPFPNPEGDPPPSTFPPIWESKRCAKTCLSEPAPACSSEEPCAQAPPCRRAPDHGSVSRVAFFKRKFVDDEDEPPFSFRTYCQTVAPVLEERAHVLRLSLEKMRFIDDPEAFLRRSVLVNNLLRRLRTEILLQSADWCFPPAGPAAPSASPSHQALHGAAPTRLCLAPQAGPPFRKRFRVVRARGGGLRADSAATCCCLYAAAAGRYLHLPFSMYDAALCPSAPHASFFQIAGHSKLGLTVAIEEHDDEDEEEEEEEEEDEEEGEEEEEERREAGTSLDAAKDKSSQKSRTRSSLGHAHTRTDREEEEEEEEEQEEEEEEEEEEGQVVLQKVSPWHRRAHRH